MIKFELEQFIEEVELELMNYEELTQVDIKNFGIEFMKLIRENKISNKNYKDGVHFEVFDEMEMFTIADDYVQALLSNDLKSYWKTFE